MNNCPTLSARLIPASTAATFARAVGVALDAGAPREGDAPGAGVPPPTSAVLPHPATPAMLTMLTAMLTTALTNLPTTLPKDLPPDLPRDRMKAGGAVPPKALPGTGG